MNDKSERTYYRPFMSPEERRKRDRRALVRAIPSDDLRAMHEKIRGDKAGGMTAVDLYYLIEHNWQEFRPALREWCQRVIDDDAA